jgi:hypothetical protein
MGHMRADLRRSEGLYSQLDIRQKILFVSIRRTTRTSYLILTIPQTSLDSAVVSRPKGVQGGRLQQAFGGVD